MGISAFDDGTRSISDLARVFGCDRRTVARLIEQHDISPAGRSAGHPTYAIADVAAAIFAPGGTDMGASDRLLHWKAKNEELRHQRAAGEVVPVEAVRAMLSALIKPTGSMLEALPDIVATAAGLSPEQAQALQEACDAERQRLYNHLAAQAATEPEEATDP